MKRLGFYVKPKIKDQSLKHVMSTVASAIQSIGKNSQSKDKNTARRAITTAIVNKATLNKRMVSNISEVLNIHPKTLLRVAKRRESIENDPINQCWSFSG